MGTWAAARVTLFPVDSGGLAEAIPSGSGYLYVKVPKRPDSRMYDHWLHEARIYDPCGSFLSPGATDRSVHIRFWHETVLDHVTSGTRFELVHHCPARENPRHVRAVGEGIITTIPVPSPETV